MATYKCNFCNTPFETDITQSTTTCVHCGQEQPILENIIYTYELNSEPLLKRAFILLEDGEFERANEFCEQILNKSPENPYAYLGKLLSELKIHKKEQLAESNIAFDSSKNYKRLIAYAPISLKEEITSYLLKAKEQLDYQEQKRQEKKEKLKITTLTVIKKVVPLLLIFTLLGSVLIFGIIPTIQYNEAQKIYKSGDLETAYEKFSKLGSFKDSYSKTTEIKTLIRQKLWVNVEDLTIQIPYDSGCNAQVNGNQIILSGNIPSINDFLGWIKAPENCEFYKAHNDQVFLIENALYAKAYGAAQAEYYDMIFYNGWNKLAAIYVSQNGKIPSSFTWNFGTWSNNANYDVAFSSHSTTIIGQYCDSIAKTNITSFEITIITPETN